MSISITEEAILRGLVKRHLFIDRKMCNGEELDPEWDIEFLTLPYCEQKEEVRMLLEEDAYWADQAILDSVPF